MAQPKTRRPVKILSVVWYNVLPARYGGQTAVALFNEHMGRLLPLTCLCASSNQRTEGISYKLINTLPTGRWQFFSPAVWWRIMRTVPKEKATHLLLEFPYHGPAGILCKLFLGTRLIVREHNIEYSRFKLMGKPWWRLLWLYEYAVLAMADKVFFMTDVDIDVAVARLRFDKKKGLFLPAGPAWGPPAPGVDYSQIIRDLHGLAPDEKILYFGGTLDYEPNADALVDLVEQVLPRLDERGFPYKILVTGRNRKNGFEYLKAIKHPRLLQLGEVASAMEYTAGCDVFVNPVTWGGGLQTKIVDALVLNTTVVCFRAQAAGFLFMGEKIRVADAGDWDQFCDLVTEAANEPKMPTRGTYWSMFDWPVITELAHKEILAT